MVNEPLDPNQSDCLSHGPFYQVLGPGYLEIALRAARQYAPPGTQLFINDFSTTDTKRLECLVKVVARLRFHGVPLDGVGHEMHNHIDNPAPRAMFVAIETLAALFPHLHQQVTELDVSVYLAGDNTSNYGANGGSVPQSLIDEQGWLHKAYFDEFRRLKGKLDAVTFWGMGDDNTWLDNFPIHRLDLPLPFDTRLQAKPAYWGIVDPTHLPGFGLSFALVSRTGPKNNRVWTVSATNPSPEVASTTQINAFMLRQVSGLPCRPVITPPGAFPVVLGDIAPTASASAAFTIDFDRCAPNAKFDLLMPWSSAKYQTGTLFLEHQVP